jgi:HPt (histidine-containing phosphotransfer) domain-containing protein
MGADPAAALEALRQRFLRRAASDLEILAGHRAAGDADAEEVRFLIHRLSGAAGSFGYPELSAIAARAEAGWLDGGGLDPAALDGLIAALEALPREDAAAG